MAPIMPQALYLTREELRLEMGMPMPAEINSKTTTTTKATLAAAASSGRVVIIENSTEPGFLSLAVPGDRAKLSPTEVVALAKWFTAKGAEMVATERAEEVAREAKRRPGLMGRRDQYGNWVPAVDGFGRPTGMSDWRF